MYSDSSPWTAMENIYLNQTGILNQISSVPYTDTYKTNIILKQIHSSVLDYKLLNKTKYLRWT